jgi:hypothetical protein
MAMHVFANSILPIDMVSVLNVQAMLPPVLTNRDVYAWIQIKYSTRINSNAKTVSPIPPPTKTD